MVPTLLDPPAKRPPKLSARRFRRYAVHTHTPVIINYVSQPNAKNTASNVAYSTRRRVRTRARVRRTRRSAANDRRTRRRRIRTRPRRGALDTIACAGKTASVTDPDNGRRRTCAAAIFVLRQPAADGAAARAHLARGNRHRPAGEGNPGGAVPSVCLCLSAWTGYPRRNQTGGRATLNLIFRLPTVSHTARYNYTRARAQQ